MKPLLTVSSVVFAHICVFLLLVNGCRGPAANPNDWSSGTKSSDTSIYSGGARSMEPVAAEPVEAEPAEATPAVAEPAPAQVSQQPKEPAAPKPATTEEKIHVVKAGEYLSTIAVRNGLTSKELADANGIALTAVLRVGQKLKIPAPKPKAEQQKAAPVDGDVYVVQKGDVLGTIARKHKISVSQLKKANNLKSDVIRIGQKLVIPSKNAPAPKAKDEAPEETKAAPAEAKAEPAEAVPAEKDAKTPAEAAPAKAEPAKKEEPKKDVAPVEEFDENFGMPEGGFGEFGEGDEDAPAEAVPAVGEPAE